MRGYRLAAAFEAFEAGEAGATIHNHQSSYLQPCDGASQSKPPLPETLRENLRAQFEERTEEDIEGGLKRGLTFRSLRKSQG